jgi:uncharacterized membrane protein YebE (DUF533 family)
MTKVETERNNCIFALLLAQKGAVADVVTEEMNKSLAALISAAHAEGVAEGEERERMRIWMLRDTVSGNPNDRVIFVPMKALMSPSSVLAPKEKP